MRFEPVCWQPSWQDAFVRLGPVRKLQRAIASVEPSSRARSRGTMPLQTTARLSRFEPKDAASHYNLALALKYKGDTREALKEFQSASDLRPKWAKAHYGLGSVWYDLQDQDAAAKELRLAESLDPADSPTHRLLARILAQQNNLVDAEHELKLALRLKSSADAHVELGVVEGQLGNLNEAAVQLRRAIQMDSEMLQRTSCSAWFCGVRRTIRARWSSFAPP